MADAFGIAGTVIRDSAGNLYGTTFYGGDSKCFTDGLNYGCGMAFKLDPSGRKQCFINLKAQ